MSFPAEVGSAVAVCRAVAKAYVNAIRQGTERKRKRVDLVGTLCERRPFRAEVGGGIYVRVELFDSRCCAFRLRYLVWELYIYICIHVVWFYGRVLHGCLWNLDRGRL